MTRKRFIKLCMSHGISRNEAQKRAESVVTFKSYAGLYESHRLEFAFRNFKYSMKSASKYMESVWGNVHGLV